jgi:hypothetical protein
MQCLQQFLDDLCMHGPLVSAYNYKPFFYSMHWCDGKIYDTNMRLIYNTLTLVTQV